MQALKSKVKTQTIYINLDDSGKLTRKETVSVYGGIVFFSKEEKDKFIIQYRSIINNIRCKYCNYSKENCTLNCPELKSFNLHSQDKRRIINYIKKYFLIGCIIDNSKIYDYIINDKASKGRYLDYAIRRTVKGIIETLINKGFLNPYEPVELIINIDEQTTKSNGYYDLSNGILEELKYGISNFNYNVKYPPVLFDNVSINIRYQKSDKSFSVQAADLIAGYIRKNYIYWSHNSTMLFQKLNIIDYKLFLP